MYKFDLFKYKIFSYQIHKFDLLNVTYVIIRCTNLTSLSVQLESVIILLNDINIKNLVFLSPHSFCMILKALNFQKNTTPFFLHATNHTSIITELILLSF